MVKLTGGKSLVDVVVTLIVALLAFLGGIYANQISTKNNQATIEAQKAESLKQFRRGQPQFDRYAAVLKLATALRGRGGFSLAALSDPKNANYINYTIAIRSTATTIEDAHGPWQDAYIALDEAISEAEVAASADATRYARALRDKYRADFRHSILRQIDAVRVRLNNLYDMNDEELADALVGVPGNPLPPADQSELMAKSAAQLTEDYRNAVRADLGIGESKVGTGQVKSSG